MHILQINVFLPSIIDKILKQTIKQKLHVNLSVTHRQNIQTDGETEITVFILTVKHRHISNQRIKQKLQYLFSLSSIDKIFKQENLVLLIYERFSGSSLISRQTWQE